MGAQREFRGEQLSAVEIFKVLVHEAYAQRPREESKTPDGETEAPPEVDQAGFNFDVAMGDLNDLPDEIRKQLGL